MSESPVIDSEPLSRFPKHASKHPGRQQAKKQVIPGQQQAKKEANPNRKKRMAKAVIMGIRSQKFIFPGSALNVSKSSVQFAQAPNTTTVPQMKMAIHAMNIT